MALAEVVVTKETGREGVCRRLGVHEEPSSFQHAAGREGGEERGAVEPQVSFFHSFNGQGGGLWAAPSPPGTAPFRR